MRAPKLFFILVAVAGVGGAALAYLLNFGDVHHSSERQAWKNQAILAIEADLESLAQGEFELPPSDEPSDEQVGWMSEKAIRCVDGSWLIYRQQCHKEDAKVHDIFIARSSDGRWFYSDFHFCIGAVVLAADEQPESLSQMAERYFLVEFDGVSDEALKPTWIR